jgi:spore germination cell wall hydrolase CwlJ-like protein
VESQEYADLSDVDLMALCCWREARGEGPMGKRGVCHTILNRVNARSFFGHDIQSVILKKYQFSSFNATDPNVDKWPAETDPSWMDSQAAAQQVLNWNDPDLTAGALYYFSPPLTAPPRAWGSVGVTLVVGNLTFCKPVPNNAADVQEALDPG